ncbi:hypothetical protein GQX74_004315 [Glossina fuscipes]|nr:hypothetical protein GQX74_004315 [Glossina fuscipes]
MKVVCALYFFEIYDDSNDGIEAYTSARSLAMRCLAHDAKRIYLRYTSNIELNFKERNIISTMKLQLNMTFKESLIMTYDVVCFSILPIVGMVANGFEIALCLYTFITEKTLRHKTLMICQLKVLLIIDENALQSLLSYQG